MLGVIGWVLVGAVLAGALLYFWNDVKEWLNNTAADMVGSVLGYNARKAMQRAVCVADRVAQMVRNKATVYYKEDPLAFHFHKVTLESYAAEYEIDKEVLSKMDEQGSLVQNFEYKG